MDEVQVSIQLTSKLNLGIIKAKGAVLMHVLAELVYTLMLFV